MQSTLRNRWSDLILICAIFLGTFLRFNPASSFGFPVGDGGLFAVMVDDLKTSHYILPRFTSYNHSDIPFAYPPLGFYFGRVASDLLGLQSPQPLRWVPAFFASLSILVFYRLALRMLGKKFHAAIATLFFALMPRALSWFVMGGGITRSPGQFFMLCTLVLAVRSYQENRRLDILWTGLFAGLTVMSHPEAAVHTIATLIFFWIMLGRSRKTFFKLVLVGFLTLVVSAPWWATILHYHGLAPLLSAAQTGQKSTAIFNLLFFTFTEEPYATVIAVLALIGLAYRLIHRDYLIALWMVVPFLVEGRSAVLPASIPLALLASVGFGDVILRSVLPKSADEPELPVEISRIEFGIMAYLILFLLFSTYQYGLQMTVGSLSSADRDAMIWVQNNTPNDARFLVLTGTNAVTCDMVLEWFPALTQRRSLYTVQGLEWMKGADFAPFVRSTYDVQRCLSDADASCLNRVVDPSRYDYVYVSKIPRPNCTAVNLPNAFSYFLESLRKIPGIQSVYETKEVVIFKK